MIQTTSLGRRTFFKTSSAVAADLVFNHGRATRSAFEDIAEAAGGKSSARKLDGNSIETKVLDDDSFRGIGKKIARGISILNKNRTPEGYREAYHTFVLAYDKSTKNQDDGQYLGTGLIALMHAGKALQEAGNNIVEGLPIGDINTANNLKKAIELYGVALDLRIVFDAQGYTFLNIYTRELGFIKIPDEKLIRMRSAQAYEALFNMTSRREKFRYGLELLTTYGRLADLSEGYEKNGYLRRKEIVLKELHNIK